MKMHPIPVMTMAPIPFADALWARHVAATAEAAEAVEAAARAGSENSGDARVPKGVEPSSV